MDSENGYLPPILLLSFISFILLSLCHPICMIVDIYVDTLRLYTKFQDSLRSGTKLKVTLSHMLTRN